MSEIIKKFRAFLSRLSTGYRLEGYDTFAAGNPQEDNPYYPLEGKYYTLKAAQGAARKRLVHLEETQPTESSGGQGINGIQDQVYIIYPDGSRVRIIE